MTKKIDVKKFREYLDELGLTHKKVGDHTFRMPIPMDDDFEESLGISFEVQEKKIQAWAAIPGFGVENPRSDSLDFCNKWNKESISPKVYIDKDGDFIAEQTIFIDEELSDDFIKTNFIMFAIASMKGFFERLNKRLNHEEDDEEEGDDGGDDDDDGDDGDDGDDSSRRRELEALARLEELVGMEKNDENDGDERESDLNSSLELLRKLLERRSSGSLKDGSGGEDKGGVPPDVADELLELLDKIAEDPDFDVENDYGEDWIGEDDGEGWKGEDADYWEDLSDWERDEEDEEENEEDDK